MTNAPAEPKPANSLEFFPINMFALIMGLGGFTIATHQLERLIGLNPVISTISVLVTSGLLALFLALYAYKIVRYPAAVQAEWNNPVKLSFFPTISISLLILSACYLVPNKQISFWLWSTGTVLQFITAFAVIRFWIRKEHFKEQHLNPAWFIPAVGNIFVPIAGAAHGYIEVSWFFFSFGLLFWLILQTIIFNRLIFHTPLPEKLLPTLFILIAPPSVGFLSYTTLTSHGFLDPFAHFLYYGALVMFLLLLSKFGQLARLRFSLSWWAYSFPMAAFTLATFRFFEITGLPFLKNAGFALYGLLALLIAILLFKTLMAALRRKICCPE